MKLYDHQQKIIAEDPKRTGLFLGTGSGKTRIALMLARGSVLVIAPKTQVQDRNWERELETLSKEYWVTNGKWDLLKFPINSVTIISKETFRRDYAILEPFDTVIVDETHTCLGVTASLRWIKGVARPKASQLYEALQTYLERTKPARLYLCTATIMRSPMTVWAAATLLGHSFDWYAFRSKYYIVLPIPHREVWSPKNNSANKDDLAALVKSIGYVGRLEDFFDVPEQTFKTITIPLTKKQEERIKQLPLEYPEPLVRIGKQHQVENGVLAGDKFSDPEEFSNGKMETILDLAAEFPRMVVFAKYTAQIVRIAYELRQSGYKVWEMTGATKDRGTLIGMANKNDGIFICQAQISAGWELPDYPVMVFASRTNSWVDYEQSLGRIQRANHIKKNLYINLVVKGGVDEAIDKALKNKQDFNERLYTEA